MSKKYNIFDWEKIALDELKGIKIDQLIKDTPEGIKVKPLYTKDDLEDLDLEDLEDLDLDEELKKLEKELNAESNDSAEEEE